MNSVPETREQEWKEFAENVREHCIEYTVPQYGEKGADQVTHWTIEDLITQIKKYCHRYGNNARPGQEHLDFMKIAHYACMAYWKYIESGKNREKNQFTIEGDFDTITTEMKKLLESDKEYKVTVKETKPSSNNGNYMENFNEVG